MKKQNLKYLAVLAVALSPATNVGGAILVGVGLGNTTTTLDDSASPNGIHWNRTANNATSPAIADLVHADTGLATGIAFSTVNAGGFFRGKDSLPDGPIVYDNISFPALVLDYGVADNFASGRDGLMVFRYVIPASLVPQNEFRINTVLGSNNATQSFEFNIGGTWGGTADRTFTGGTTVSAAGSTANHTFVTLSDIQAVYDPVGETYTLDLQYGYTGGGTGGVVAVRGITVAVIPEPGTYALIFGLASLGFVLLRMRRQRLREE